jgi:hypothetical protein
MSSVHFPNELSTMPSEGVYSPVKTRPKTAGAIANRNGAAVNLRYEFDARRINSKRPSSSSRSVQVSKPLIVTNSKSMFIKLSDQKSASAMHAPSSSGDAGMCKNSRPGSPNGPADGAANGGELSTIEEYSAEGSSVNLTKRDKAALQIGRLVLGTIISKPEITTADQLARFFFDQWLHRSGSQVQKADIMSIDLMCELQKYHTITQSIHVQEDIEQIESSADGVIADEHVAQRIIKAQTLVGKAAFKALQRMAKEFRGSSPILDEITKSLSPLVFEMHEEDLNHLDDPNGLVDFENNDLLTWKEMSKMLMERIRRTAQDNENVMDRLRKLDDIATTLHIRICELRGQLTEEEHIDLTALTNHILEFCSVNFFGKDLSRYAKTKKNWDSLRSRMIEKRSRSSSVSSMSGKFLSREQSGKSSKTNVLDHSLEIKVMDGIVEEEDDHVDAERKAAIMLKLRQFIELLREKVDLLKQTDYTSGENVADHYLVYMERLINEQDRLDDDCTDAFDILEFLNEFMPTFMDDYVHLKTMESNNFTPGKAKSSTTQELRMAAMRAQNHLVDKKYRQKLEELQKAEAQLATAKKQNTVLMLKEATCRTTYEHNLGQLKSLQMYLEEKEREWAANSKYNELSSKYAVLRERYEMLWADSAARDHLYALMAVCKDQAAQIETLSEFDKGMNVLLCVCTHTFVCTPARTYLCMHMCAHKSCARMCAWILSTCCMLSILHVVSSGSTHVF